MKVHLCYLKPTRRGCIFFATYISPFIFEKVIKNLTLSNALILRRTLPDGMCGLQCLIHTVIKSVDG